MNVEARQTLIHVVCPACHSTNRVLATRTAEARCGDCRTALFAGHPVAVTEASLARQIARSDVPVVVDFWAPWCAPCRTMAPVFDAAARALEPACRFVKVNTDEEQGAAKRYQIRGIPTFAIFKNGTEVARTSGAMHAPRFVEWVRANT